VVDDNIDAAESLAVVLRAMGHEACTAHDGYKALETGGAYQPEVVFLDIGMPKMNGYEVARRMREQTWGKGALLVALTGWGQDDDRRRSREAGFDEHLVKPVDLDRLGELLATVPQAG
jgi:DNA-binding response OmpR family regulator